MAVWTHGPKTFSVASAIPLYTRVKLSSSSGTQVEAAGDNEVGIGVVCGIEQGKGTSASGDVVTVHLHNLGGTVKVIASEAFAAGATLFGAADGEVTDTDGGSDTQIYTALEAATADGDIVEALIA